MVDKRVKLVVNTELSKLGPPFLSDRRELISSNVLVASPRREEVKYDTVRHGQGPQAPRVTRRGNSRMPSSRKPIAVTRNPFSPGGASRGIQVSRSKPDLNIRRRRKTPARHQGPS